MPLDKRSQMLIKKIMDKNPGLSYEAAYRMVASEDKSGSSDQERALDSLSSREEIETVPKFARLGASNGIDAPLEEELNFDDDDTDTPFAAPAQGKGATGQPWSPSPELAGAIGGPEQMEFYEKMRKPGDRSQEDFIKFFVGAIDFELGRDNVMGGLAANIWEQKGKLPSGSWNTDKIAARREAIREELDGMEDTDTPASASIPRPSPASAGTPRPSFAGAADFDSAAGLPEEELPEEELPEGYYRDPSERLRRAPTPIDYDPTAEEGSLEPDSMEPIPTEAPGSDEEAGDSIVRKEDGGFRGLVNALTRKNDPEIKTDAPYLTDREKVLNQREKTRRDGVREGKEYTAEGITLNGVPIKVDGSKKGLYHDRIKRQQDTASKDRRMSGYLEDNGYYNPDGSLNEDKLEGADYGVRAWVESKKVLSGKGIEGPGDSGRTHTEWGHNESPRHNRLVKTAHFNTGGHVVPHPTREGQFIVVRSDGSRIHDMAGAWGDDNKLARAERLEANRRRVKQQPHRYAKAFKVAEDRDRMVAAKKHPSLHIGIAMEMNMPPQSPEVLRELDRRLTGGLSSRPQGRYWQGRSDMPIGIGGPSGMDALHASFYGSGESGGKGTPAKVPHFSKEPTPEQADANMNLQAANNGLAKAEADYVEANKPGNDTDEGRRLQGAINRAERKQAVVQRRWVDAMGRGGGGGQNRRADLRAADLSGHYDDQFRRPISITGNPWDQAEGVSKTRRLQDEWEDWKTNGIDEESRAAAGRVEDAAAAEDEPGPTPADRPIPSGSGGGGMAGSDDFDYDRGSGHLDNPREVGSVVESVTGYRPGEIAEDPESSVPSSERRPMSEAPSEVEIGPSTAEFDPSDRESLTRWDDGVRTGRIKPYQPTVRSDGETEYEDLDLATYRADKLFDERFSDKLFAIKEKLDSTDIKPTDSWWQGAMKYLGIRPSGDVSKMWFDTYVAMATREIKKDPDFEGVSKHEINNMIFRWGDRHISPYARKRSGLKETSTYWLGNSPTLTRGRRPAVSKKSRTIYDAIPGFSEDSVDVGDNYMNWEGVGSDIKKGSRKVLGAGEDAGDFIREYSPEWLKGAQDKVSSWLM